MMRFRTVAVAMFVSLSVSAAAQDFSEADLEGRYSFSASAEQTDLLPVHLVDERFTSRAAERAVRGIGLPKKKREQKGRVDAAAAVLILQSWLDARARA